MFELLINPAQQNILKTIRAQTRSTRIFDILWVFMQSISRDYPSQLDVSS
jgi:hypothetical protein